MLHHNLHRFRWILALGYPLDFASNQYSWSFLRKTYLNAGGVDAEDTDVISTPRTEASNHESTAQRKSTHCMLDEATCMSDFGQRRASLGRTKLAQPTVKVEILLSWLVALLRSVCCALGN